MKTILELIESWKPCPSYNDYVEAGHLHAGMTIDDILWSSEIADEDIGWFFEQLFEKRLSVYISHNIVYVWYDYSVYEYTFPDFLAMVDEYLEHANIDAAI